MTWSNGMHHAIDEGERREHKRAGNGMLAFRLLTPVARSRCRLCWVRKTQPKIPLKAPSDCCAAFGANAEGGAAAGALSGAKGLIAFISAWAPL